MMKLAKVRPSPAMAVALLGVALSLGGTGWAANGVAFVLGAVNSATQQSALVANYNGMALALSNSSAGAAATALSLAVAAGHPPMKVNTTIKVTNLNADYVDGIDASTQLMRVMRVPFTLAAGATTAAIVLPANLPVHIMGNGIPGTDSLGQVTIVRDSAGGTLWWVGAESQVGEITTKGVSNVPGHYIVSLDFYAAGGGGAGDRIEVEVNGPTAIQVHNGGGVTHSGEITLTW